MPKTKVKKKITAAINEEVIRCDKCGSEYSIKLVQNYDPDDFFTEGHCDLWALDEKRIWCLICGEPPDDPVTAEEKKEKRKGRKQ